MVLLLVAATTALSPDQRITGKERGSAQPVGRADDALDPASAQAVIGRTDPAPFHVDDALARADDLPGLDSEDPMVAAFLPDLMELCHVAPPLPSLI